MKKKNRYLVLFALALLLPVAMIMVISVVGVGCSTSLSRPEGPCDIYSAAGNPCVAAHSSTPGIIRIL